MTHIIESMQMAAEISCIHLEEEVRLENLDLGD